MKNDDQPAGTILSRRDALRVLGVGSAAFLVAYARNGGNILLDAANRSAAPIPMDCIVRPELPAGPYFVDDQLNRSDIRYDPLEGNVSVGIPLFLKIVVFDAAYQSCTPLEGARVDIWHCDYMGIYSGVEQRGFNTTGQKFLRGYQLTDAKGVVQFQTVYPGWYSGRTVHVHFKIRTKAKNGRDYEFTSQLFFEDRLTDHVHAQKPYVKKGKRDTRNEKDNLLKESKYQLMLKTSGNLESGIRASINIGLDLSDTETGAPDIL
jgi:protocatechuate 3,4-dioxygenase beta subunit